MRKIILITCLAICAAPAVAGKKAEISGLELQQIQSRDLEGSYDVVFPSVVTVLQDGGYRIQSADKNSGLVTGQASTNSVTTLNIFWGWGKKKRTPVVSAFIEPRGPQITRIRLSFVLATTKNRIYGMA